MKDGSGMNGDKRGGIKVIRKERRRIVTSVRHKRGREKEDDGVKQMILLETLNLRLSDCIGDETP